MIFLRYLTNGADCLKREPSYFKKQYDELVNAMDLVGFTDEEEDNLFSIVAAVLHMGNVTFEMDDDEASFVEDENGPVKMAAVSSLCIWYLNVQIFFFFCTIRWIFVLVYFPIKSYQGHEFIFGVKCFLFCKFSYIFLYVYSHMYSIENHQVNNRNVYMNNTCIRNHEKVNL